MFYIYIFYLDCDVQGCYEHGCSLVGQFSNRNTVIYSLFTDTSIKIFNCILTKIWILNDLK